MQALPLLLLISLTTAAWAQQSSQTPKKDPFAGFGNTGLDRKPGGGAASALTPVGRKPSPPAPAAPTTTTPTTATVPASSASSGIVLASEWSGHLSQGSGGQTMKMADLQALLSGYGSPELDVAAHPEVTIYAGPTMDSGGSQSCRVTYLMPLDKAEAVLFRSRGISTVSKAVAPGFPDGLFIHNYDVKVGIYTRLSILTDSAKPVAQVVSLLLKAPNANWYPAAPPWKKLERAWHTHDYMNTENKGQPGLVIDTRVYDRRSEGGFLIVNTTGGSWPPLPEMLFKPARSSPKETTTWYLPQPMIKLILHCLSKQAGK